MSELLYVRPDGSIVDLDALVGATREQDPCDTFWGSHGCDLPTDHDLPHVCGVYDSDGVCSIHDGIGVRHVAWADADGEIPDTAVARAADRVVLSATRYPCETFSIGQR